MSSALFFIYVYVVMGLITSMYVLRELRRLNDNDYSDGAAAAVAIVVGVFWLPFLVVITVAVVAGRVRP